MSDLLVVQNSTREGPGLLESILHEEQITYDLVDLDQGEVFPLVQPYKGVVVLGGPDSANDETPKMLAERGKVEEVLRRQIPYLGICLGLQVMVKAASGQVMKSPVKEVGFTDQQGEQHVVTLTGEGRQDPLFEGLDEVLPVFHLHGESVGIKDRMKLLATGKDCYNQIVRVGPTAYGIQSHFELTPEMLELWAMKDPDLTPIGKEKLLGQFATIQEAYTQTGNTLFRNFLKIAGLMST